VIQKLSLNLKCNSIRLNFKCNVIVIVIELKIVIELTFDEGLGLGCRSEGHINIRFEKLYVLPCPKTLVCDYFKTIFDDKPSDDIEIEV